MIVAEKKSLSRGARRGLVLSITAALGPLAWFGAQLVLYAYTAADCERVASLSIWAVLAGATLLGAAATGYLCRLALQLPKQPGVMSAEEWGRTRLMVFGGIALNVLSLLLLLSFAIPIITLRPCA